MREFQIQEELDLGEYINFKPFADEKARKEEYDKFRHSIANRILAVVEEVYGVIDCPCPSLVGQVLGEELAPILKEWRDFNNNK